MRTFLKNALPKLSIVAGFIALVFLFMALTVRGHKNITDEDTWFHISTGKYILEHGIPTTEVFSASIDGQFWNNHEWLWQIFLHSVHAAFGPASVVYVQLFFLLSLFTILLFLTYKEERLFLAVPLLFSVILVSPDRSWIRPDIVSAWFALIFFAILSRFLKSRWAPYALFILQVLWTNIHGFFILGPLVVAVLWLAEFIKRRIPLPYEWNSADRLEDSEYRRLKKVLAAVVLACLVNPQFIEGFLYPVKIILDSFGESKFFYSYLGELHRPISRYNIFVLDHRPIYKLLLLLSSASFLLNRRRIDLRLFAFWAFFLCFSMAAARNIVFFGIAAYLAIMINLGQLRLEKVRRMWTHAAVIILHVGISVWMISYMKPMLADRYFDPYTKTMKSHYDGQLSESGFARHAADFITAHKIRGNFFNNLHTGQRLIVRHYPDIKIYIDGRTEVYGTEFFRTYIKIFEEGDWGVFQKEAEKHNLTGVFLSFISGTVPAKFFRQLYYSPEWELVYLNYDAAIFLKNVPDNEDQIARLRVDLNQWTTIAADDELLRIPGAAKVYYTRGLILKTLDLYEQASRETAEALRIHPVHVEALTLQAEIFQLAKESEKALGLLQKALAHSPRSISLMREVASTYEDLHNYENALQVSRRMIDQAPRDPRGHFVQSRILAKKHLYAKSFEALVEASELGLKESELLHVADFLYAQKAYAWAKKAYQLALTMGKSNPNVQERLSLIEQAERAGADVALSETAQ